MKAVNISTPNLAWLAMSLLAVGSILDAMTGPLWVRFGIHAKGLEYAGTVLAYAGYWALWILLPVAAFRPENRFHVQGECLLRVKRCGLVLGLLLFVHLCVVGIFIYVFHGGFGV